MSEEKPITVEDAHKIIAEDQHHRERECMAAINAALKEHRCRLVTVETRVNGQITDLTVKAEAME